MEVRPTARPSPFRAMSLALALLTALLMAGIAGYEVRDVAPSIPAVPKTHHPVQRAIPAAQSDSPASTCSVVCTSRDLVTESSVSGQNPDQSAPTHGAVP
jgi:hypothetical protein